MESIFDDTRDPTWKGESWIKTIEGGLQMMRVDIRNPELDHAVLEYEVKSTPKVIVFENFKIVVEEVIGIDTYDKIKEKVYKKPASTPSQPSSQAPIQQKPAVSSTKPAVEVPKSGGVSIGGEKPPQNPAPSQIYQQSVPKNSAAESECREAVRKAEDAADRATQALNDLKKQYENYKELVKAQKEAKDAKQEKIGM